MKKKIQELVKASYDGGQLDKNLVETIADRLNRNTLKQYVKSLKQEEKKAIVFITTPKPLTTEDRKKIKALFPKKKIVEQIDAAMINGIKVVENDEEYEMNLNRTFHDIIRHVIDYD